MRASYFAVLFEYPLVREKKYRISALSGETNITPILTRISCEFSFLSPVGIFEVPSNYIFHPSWGTIIMTSSSGRSVARGDLSGAG